MQDNEDIASSAAEGAQDVENLDPAGNGGGGEEADPRAAARQALNAKMAAAAFGEIVALFMRSPGHKHYSLSDLEWMVLPAVMANQFAFANAKAKNNTSLSVPVGVALWARVSEEVDAEISSNLDRPLRLRPDQWSSGDINWLVDVIAGPEVGRALVDQLSRTAFAGKEFKMRVADKEGKRTVRTMTGADPDAAAEEPAEAEEA